MHEVLVNRLGGLSLSRKSVVRLTDRPDMTLDVYRGTTMQHLPKKHDCITRTKCLIRSCYLDSVSRSVNLSNELRHNGSSELQIRARTAYIRIIFGRFTHKNLHKGVAFTLFNCPLRIWLFTPRVMSGLR